MRGMQIESTCLRKAKHVFFQARSEPEERQRIRDKSGWSKGEGAWKHKPLAPALIYMFFVDVSISLLFPEWQHLLEEFEAEHDTTIKSLARSSGKGGYVMHGDRLAMGGQACHHDHGPERSRSFPTNSAIGAE